MCVAGSPAAQPGEACDPCGVSRAIQRGSTWEAIEGRPRLPVGEDAVWLRQLVVNQAHHLQQQGRRQQYNGTPGSQGRAALQLTPPSFQEGASPAADRSHPGTAGSKGQEGGRRQDAVEEGCGPAARPAAHQGGSAAAAAATQRAGSGCWPWHNQQHLRTRLAKPDVLLARTARLIHCRSSLGAQRLPSGC